MHWYSRKEIGGAGTAWGYTLEENQVTVEEFKGGWVGCERLHFKSE